MAVKSRTGSRFGSPSADSNPSRLRHHHYRPVQHVPALLPDWVSFVVGSITHSHRG